MKLRNQNPADHLGRTVIWRNKPMRIESITPDGIRVKRNGVTVESGLLRFDQFAQCTLYPTHGEVAARFPKLLRALRWACFLTQAEAEATVHGAKTTGPFFMGTEAISHLGGSGNAIRQAMRCRHSVQRQPVAQLAV